MDAAYGLAIILNMLMTTSLLLHYIDMKRMPRWWLVTVAVILIPIELVFMFSNLIKFTHGGWVSLMMSIVIIIVMWIWFKGRKIKNRYITFTHINNHLDMLKELSHDQSIQLPNNTSDETTVSAIGRVRIL